VSLIKNKATINEDLDPSIVISRLKGEILTLREEIAFLKDESGEGDVLKPAEVEDIKARCREYVNDTDPAKDLSIGKRVVVIDKCS
jgi:kinesin family protein 6/9